MKSLENEKDIVMEKKKDYPTPLDRIMLNETRIQAMSMQFMN